MSQNQHELQFHNQNQPEEREANAMPMADMEAVPNPSTAFANQSPNRESSDYANQDVQVELERQPPPSRVGGTRAAHKNSLINKGLTPAQQEIQNGQSPYQQSSKIHEPQSRQDQILQQQQLHSMKNWPFYQNSKDARRGGTAPEGANRAKITANTNPYGMVTGKDQPSNQSGAQVLKISNVQDKQQMGPVPQTSSSNRSGASGGAVSSQNGTQPAVTQSNQMIAEIYGKSNKFVVNRHHGSSSGNHRLNDQYKKPKIQHMKEIIRQKTSQQKTEKPDFQGSSSKPGTAQQTQNGRNLRKIKIDNSKLKSMQTNTRKNQGSQLERESQEIVARSTKNRANANRSQDFVEDNTSMIYRDKPQSTKFQPSSNATSRLDVQANTVPSQMDRKMPNSNSQIPTDSMEQIYHPKQGRNESKSRQSQRIEEINYQSHSAESMSRQASKNMQIDENLQGSQGQGQGQGQGSQIGNQLKDEIKQLKHYQNKGRNQPIRGIHAVGPSAAPNEDADHQPNFEIEADNMPDNTDIQLPVGDFSAVLPTENESGPTMQKSQNPNETYVAYASQNNVQFSSKNNSNLSINADQIAQMEKGTTPHSHKRSKQLSNLNDVGFDSSTYAAEGQPDLETLGKFFSNNLTSPSGENTGASLQGAQHAVDFSVAQQQYSEMKRLQTSQGPRIQKYKQSQQMSASNKEQHQVVPIPHIPQERPQERSQHERPERTERPQERQQPERPPLTAPSSQMQRMQMNQKNNMEIPTTQGKKIAKIKGKLSSQFQVTSLGGPGGDGLDMAASTIQNNQSMPDNCFENGHDQNDANECAPHMTQQFSRTIDTTPNMLPHQQKVHQVGMNSQGPTPQANANFKQNLPQASSNSQPQTPANQSQLAEHKRQNDILMNSGFLNQPLSTKAAQGNVDDGSAPASGVTVLGPAGPVAMQAATLGYQFEQWQRPPSRQKEPNQALGLDDTTRPKTRGGGGNSLGGPPANIATHHHHSQFYGGHPNHTSHMSGRERKRNIQKFIPSSQTGVISISNIYQGGPQETQGPSTVGGRAGNNNVQGPQPSGARPRVIDFFHQRNNNINGFNSTGDQTQYFQNQYQQQGKVPLTQASLGQQATFDERTDFSPLGHSTQAQVLAGTNSAQPNPRRGGASSGNVNHGSSQQRPPSRHKDPPQNLGLDLYPPGVGFASPNEFGPPLFGGGHTPAGHASLGGPSMGGGIVGLDIDSDFENGYDAVGPDSDVGQENLEIIDLDNAGYFWGHGRGGAAVLHKQFKEDEEDFLDSQYHQQQRFSEGVERSEKVERAERRHNQTQKGAKFGRQPSESAPNQSNQITYHPRGGPGHGSHQSVGGGAAFQPNSQHLLGQPGGHPQQQFAQTYGHGMTMGPMVPGTAPAPSQQNHQQFQYHPAPQQTQNFYIGMNQILPPGSNQDASLLANDFFNMSANVSNLVNGGGQHQPPKTASMHQSRRGQISNGNQAFHSTGFVQNDGQQTAHHLHHNSNNINQELLSREFFNQRSPVNERSGAIQHLVLQNPHLKSMNKPKSANGNRISGNKNRFKNLNNSGRFVGQNSTIIHSAYSNQNKQHLKAYSKPKAGGWIGDASQTNSGSKNIGNTSGLNSGVQTSKSGKAQQKIKPGPSAGTINGGRGQLFLVGESSQQENSININNSNSNNNNKDTNQNQQAPSNDNIKEIIKIGQEINFNRPKESKGQRSTEKRHINNQSLGITSSGGPGLVQSAVGNSTSSQAAQGVRNPKSGNFVSSPLAGGMNINSNQNFKKAHNTSKNANGKEMFSQTSKFQSGPGGALQQNSMGVATDKLTDLTDLIPNASAQNTTSGLTGFQSANQNSFKSQTLQFPTSLNSQLGDDFINLFAKN